MMMQILNFSALHLAASGSELKLHLRLHEIWLCFINKTNYELNNEAIGKVKYQCHLESLLYLMFNLII